MDRLLVFQYLKDGADNYILDGDDNFIVNATAEYPLDLSTAGIASYRGDLRAVNSFSVIANDAGDDWTLIINQYNLVGRFPSQATALGALVGCFIHADADQDGLEFMISEMVQDGRGQIDEDGDNLMSQKIQNGEFIGTIRNFNKDTFVGTLSQTQENAMLVGAVSETLLLNDPLQTITVPARYDNSYAFTVRTDNVQPNAIELPAEVIPALSNENISFPKQTPLVGVAYEADFTVDGLDSRIPVNTVYTWSTSAPGAEAWQERQTGSSSSFTPLENYAGLVIRCEVELFYLDGTSTGTASSETTSVIGQIWTWTGAPFLYESTVGQTIQVTPTLDASLQSTGTGQGGGLSYDYAFMKDNTTVQSGSSSVYNFDGIAGTYTCEVTTNQTFNGVNYQSTQDAAPPFIVTPNITPRISYLEMWTGINDSAPDGTQITNLNSIPTDSTYYVFAYDQFDALITDEVLYGDSRSPVATSISAQASTNAAAVGDTLTVDNIVVEGDPEREPVTYQWMRGATPQSTDPTYSVTPNDIGFSITCIVSVISNGTSDTVILDFGTPSATGQPPNVSIDSLTPDPATEGDTLTITASATGDAPITFEYQFERTSNGDILQAYSTSNTYLTSSSDVGEIIRARVKGTNTSGDDVETANWSNAVQASSGSSPAFTYTKAFGATPQFKYATTSKFWTDLEGGTFSNNETGINMSSSTIIAEESIQADPGTFIIPKQTGVGPNTNITGYTVGFQLFDGTDTARHEELVSNTLPTFASGKWKATFDAGVLADAAIKSGGTYGFQNGDKLVVNFYAP